MKTTFAALIILVALSVGDSVEVYGADAELTATIDTAVDRFNNAGLDLPDLRVYVHPTDDECTGYQAQFAQNNEFDRIDLCTGRTLYIVLHELAHAWEHHYMSDTARQAFIDHTGLAWYDPNIDPRRRGFEAVANTIAWSLLEAPLTATDAANHSELLHRFELLTGFSSPRLDADALGTTGPGPVTASADTVA